MCPLCRDPVQTTSGKRSKGTMVHHSESLRLAARYEGSGAMMYNDSLPISTDGQPKGTMQHRVQPFNLPGYKNCGTILIQYSMNSGIQGPQHPNPGQRYDSTSRTAYLPDNHQGRDVMRLLKKAFDRGLVFTVGRSMTSGYDNQIVWGDIPHKTCINGGPSNYGYPDPTYLTEVQQMLKAMLNT
ncbi:E3 ubiquitin-protein ligase DTX3L [Exaiptasia diaphana]|nr:E3 ubiquitin-protein ligase DTX3L [Exaiptasia diaphana]